MKKNKIIAFAITALMMGSVFSSANAATNYSTSYSDSFSSSSGVTGVTSGVSVSAPKSKVTFSISTNTTSSVTLSWSKVACDGYIVEQNKNGQWVTIKNITNAATLKTTVSNLTAGNIYTFRMRAYNTAVNVKSYGPVSTVVTTCTKPAAPYVKLSSAKKITWNKINGATGYVVQVFNGNSLVYSKTISNPSTLSTDIPLTSKGDTYKVIATKTLNGKSYSSAASNSLLARSKTNNKTTSVEMVTTFNVIVPKLTASKGTCTISINGVQIPMNYIKNSDGSYKGVFTGKKELGILGITDFSGELYISSSTAKSSLNGTMETVLYGKENSSSTKTTGTYTLLGTITGKCDMSVEAKKI